MVTVAKWIGGVLAYVAAFAASFLVLASFTARANALGASGAVMVLVPFVAAAALARPLRRVDPKARFLDHFIGLSGIWALVVIGTMLAFARGRLSSLLLRVPEQYPAAGVAVHAGATKLGHALTPAEPATVAIAPSSTPSSSTSSSPPTLPIPSAPKPSSPLDASALVTTRESSARDASVPVQPPELRVFAAIETCEDDGEILDYAMDAQAADFDRDGIDEIVVRCRLSAEVWSLTEGGKLLQTYRFAPEPPKDLVRSVGFPSAADLDGDGHTDLLLCVTWESKGQGTRGGQTWSAAGRSDGTFAELAAIDRVACNAVALHDVTGDRVPELLIVQRGNPWQREAPNGAVAWLARSGHSWRQQGRVQVSTFPDAITFRDANGDGIDDVVVSHGWSTDREPRLLLGGKKGLTAADAGTDTIPPLPDRKLAEARFDRDGAPDQIAIEDRKVKLLRTEPWRFAIIEHLDRRP